MQIIIAQFEIEEAIKNYVCARIAVSGNTEITVDLTAGRGADGFKATIELTDKAVKQAAPAKPIIRSATVDVPAKAAEVMIEAEAVAGGVDVVAEEVAALDEPVTAATQEAEAQDPQTPAAAPTAPTSLFKGLPRPKNAV
jgi:hypothetical protein